MREIHRVFLPMLQLPPDQMMPAFIRAQMRDGVEPPPMMEGLPPPWMADRPVYYSYNSLSNETWERKAERLRELFPNITVERYEGLSHLNTSHAAEPERVAAALRRLWGWRRRPARLGGCRRGEIPHLACSGR